MVLRSPTLVQGDAGKVMQRMNSAAAVFMRGVELLTGRGTPAGEGPQIGSARLRRDCWAESISLMGAHEACTRSRANRAVAASSCVRVYALCADAGPSIHVCCSSRLSVAYGTPAQRRLCEVSVMRAGNRAKRGRLFDDPADPARNLEKHQ